MKLDPVLRINNVIANVGLSRASIYRLIGERKFPPPVKVSDRAVAWRQSDINDWLCSRQTPASMRS